MGNWLTDGVQRLGRDVHDLATDEQVRKAAWDAAVAEVQSQLPTPRQMLGAGEMVVGAAGAVVGSVAVAAGAATAIAGVATTPEGIGVPVAAGGAELFFGGAALTAGSAAFAAKGWEDFTSSEPTSVSPSDQTGSPTGPDWDPTQPPQKQDPKAQEKLDNTLSDYQTRRYQVDDQTFQLDKSGMRHILERHSPEYWDGSTKANQTFFRPGTTPEDVQRIAGDVLKQNRDSIVSTPNAYERSLVGSSDGAKYQISIYQGRITSVVPLP